jgi:hypothetical protein
VRAMTRPGRQRPSALLTICAPLPGRVDSDDNRREYECEYGLVSGHLNSHLGAVSTRARCSYFRLVAVSRRGSGRTFNPKVAGSSPAPARPSYPCTFACFDSRIAWDDQQFGFDIFVKDIRPEGQVVAVSRRAELQPEVDVGFFASDVYVLESRPAADLAVAQTDAPDPATARGQVR